MPRATIMFALVTLLLLAILSVAARATVLTFDDLGFSGDVGTFDSDVYLSQGALMSSNGNQPLTYRHDGVAGYLSHSYPYCIAVGPSDATPDWGTIRVDFVEPATSIPTTAREVIVWAGDNSSELEEIIATAYDHLGSIIVADTFVTENEPVKMPSQDSLTLHVSGISYITISSTHAAGFDDLTFSLESSWLCGDADASGEVDIDDVVYLIAYIFAGGPAPAPIESGDTDCSGGVDIDDVVYLISYIFGGGNSPCDPDGDGQPDCWTI